MYGGHPRFVFMSQLNALFKITTLYYAEAPVTLPELRWTVEELVEDKWKWRQLTYQHSPVDGISDKRLSLSLAITDREYDDRKYL